MRIDLGGLSSIAFYGVAVAPGGDVWAVGEEVRGARSRPAIERWRNGAARAVPTPGRWGITGELRDVTAPADDEAWAVGLDDSGRLVLRWDGRRWSRVPAPAGSYWGISASATDDVWAVGTNAAGPLVSHWDGSEWAEVDFPSVSGEGELAPVSPEASKLGATFLNAVLSLSQDDVWVAGQLPDESPLVSHWNGRQWSFFPLPSVPANTAFYALAAGSATDVWVAGGVVAHWDGNRWSVRGAFQEADGIAITGPGGVWATEWYEGIRRLDGSRWVPLIRGSTQSFTALARAANGDVWAVGPVDASDGPVMVRFRCVSGR